MSHDGAALTQLLVADEKARRLAVGLQISKYKNIFLNLLITNKGLFHLGPFFTVDVLIDKVDLVVDQQQTRLLAEA